jgi:hypothetical protein
MPFPSGTLPPIYTDNFPTQPSQFFKVFMGAFEIGGGMAYTDDEHFTGTFEQPIGQKALIREPGMRSGRGHFTKFKYFKNNLHDAIQSLNIAGVDPNDVDWRYIPISMTTQYNDGPRSESKLLVNCYIQRLSTVSQDGTKLLSEDVDFEFERAVYQ